MATGLMLTTPGGSRFWHPCTSPAKGLTEMEAQQFVYGAAWGHAGTSIEFGESDGEKFVPSQVLKAAAVTATPDRTIEQILAKWDKPEAVPVSPVSPVSPTGVEGGAG